MTDPKRAVKTLREVIERWPDLWESRIKLPIWYVTPKEDQ